MEQKICSLTPVISIYYNLHLEFMYSTYLTDTDKLSDFKIHLLAYRSEGWKSEMNPQGYVPSGGSMRTCFLDLFVFQGSFASFYS